MHEQMINKLNQLRDEISDKAKEITSQLGLNFRLNVVESGTIYIVEIYVAGTRWNGLREIRKYHVVFDTLHSQEEFCIYRDPFGVTTPREGMHFHELVKPEIGAVLQIILSNAYGMTLQVITA